jgi:hypothetical protein
MPEAINRARFPTPMQASMTRLTLGNARTTLNKNRIFNVADVSAMKLPSDSAIGFSVIRQKTFSR